MRLASIGTALRRAYLEIDPRTLGLGRIGLGLLLLMDLLRRVPWLPHLYGNDGLLPNHTLLWRPPTERQFSIFFMASWSDEAAVLFVLCFLVYFCLLIGYRTRVAHFLSFLACISLHNRIQFAENGGAVAMACLVLWSMFLPLDRRFSVDAVLASLRARRAETPADLAAGLPPPDDRPHSSLAMLALLAQLAVIYYFNFIHKSGPTWRDGTAVHYVLWQERIITVLGVWVRTHLPFGFTRLLTQGTLVVEASAPLLLLTPVFWRITRPLAIVGLAGLHIGIALMVNLGAFSAAMLAYYPFLLAREHWELLGRLVPRRGRRREIQFDAASPLCFQLARISARLDSHRRLSFAPSPTTDGDALLVVAPETGQRWQGYDAAVQVLRALPLGGWWTIPLRLPLLRALPAWLFDRLARKRQVVAAGLGLTTATAIEPPPPPLRRWWWRWRPVLRELLVAAVVVQVAIEVLVANPSIPRALKPPRPYWMVAAIQYAHLFEGWTMFSPDAPLRDLMVYVDAFTRDGRHVDPLNRVGSRTSRLPLTDIPVRLGHDSFFCDYTLRIPDAGVYHQAFIEWILRYPKRTGNPEDEIVSFEAHVIEHASPAPGEPGPKHPSDRVFLRYPRP
jgi:predicted DCC family thiol-disulfide oxidoreductase YuxK